MSSEAPNESGGVTVEHRQKLLTKCAPKSPCAVAVAKAWGAIAPFCAPSLDADRYYVSAIAEMNRLTHDAFSSPAVTATAVTAAKNLAQVGLIPGDAQKLAWFIPYKIGAHHKITVVIGYRGYIELAFAGGFLKDLHTDVVCSGEEFAFWKDETGPRLKHVVGLERMVSWQSIVGSYCIYHTRDGGHGVKVVNLGEINAVRPKDSGQSFSPWVKYPGPMACKTAIRRVANEWPQVPELKLALYLEEKTELERAQPDLASVAKEPLNLNDLPDEE